MREQDLQLNSNIKTVGWAPQNDVLGHPAVQALVAHGRNNSVYEAAYHGVPLVVIPCVAEQSENAVKVGFDHAQQYVLERLLFAPCLITAWIIKLATFAAIHVDKFAHLTVPSCMFMLVIAHVVMHAIWLSS